MGVLYDWQVPVGVVEKDFSFHDEMVDTMHVLGIDHESKCFYCCETLTLPAVYWVGLESIAMHPKCAADLRDGLNLDVLEAKLLGRIRRVSRLRHELEIE